jgi:hypothetical protein
LGCFFYFFGWLYGIYGIYGIYGCMIQWYPGVCGHWRLRCQSTFDTRHGAGDHHGGHTVLPEPRGALFGGHKGQVGTTWYNRISMTVCFFCHFLAWHDDIELILRMFLYFIM